MTHTNPGRPLYYYPWSRRGYGDLGAVDGHSPQLHQPSLAAQAQPLLEQPGQRRPMPLSEVTQGAEIRLVSGTQKAERDAVLKLPGQLARRVHPRAVAVQQDFDHHARVIRR